MDTSTTGLNGNDFLTFDDYLSQPLQSSNTVGLPGGFLNGPSCSQSPNPAHASTSTQMSGPGMFANCSFDQQQAAQVLRSMKQANSRYHIDATATIMELCSKIAAQERDIAELKRTTELAARQLEDRMMKDVDQRFACIKKNFEKHVGAGRSNRGAILHRLGKTNALLSNVVAMLQDLDAEMSHEHGVEVPS